MRSFRAAVLGAGSSWFSRCLAVVGAFGLAAGLAELSAAEAADDYQLGPDSQPQSGVPQGKLEKFSFASSRIFPGTVRDNWIYVPAQYRPDVPACVMVFQDGERWAKADGQWRVPIVFDNLIERREMPVTIGVFTNPGVVPAPNPNAQPRYNRSVEYDGIGDAYARFLLEELLPAVGKRYNLSADPNCRGLAGSSSGGVAAFTAAWHRPDAFRRVFSAIGTYVGLRGGDAYPTLVRKSEPRPVRVFLQDGSNDNNGYGGSWWFANQAMLSALEFSGYEVGHVWGDGAHTGKHGGAILPDALRFLWKGFPAAPKAGVGSRQPLLEVVGPEADWQLVGQGYTRLAAVTTGPGGDVFFSDAGAGRIYRLGADGKPVVFVARSGGATALAMAPDGRLVAAQPQQRRVVAFDRQGHEIVIASGIAAADLAVAANGLLWMTDSTAGQISVIDSNGAAKGARRVVAQGLGRPAGLVLTPDQAFLHVGDREGRFVTSFEVLPDGNLAHGQAFCHLHLDDDAPGSGAGGLAMDITGRLYVASRLGLQFCDQAGRVNGIISLPEGRAVAQASFGGAGVDALFAVTDQRLYRRQSKTRGVIAAEPPIKPPAPKL
jgi:gluconolactonase